MAREEREIKRKRKKKFRIVLVTLVMLYLLFRVLPLQFVFNSKNHTVLNGFVEVTDKTTGIIVRDEKVYYSNESGIINFFGNEGDKIAVGKKIVSVSITDSQEIKEKINIIENNINSLKKGNVATVIFNEDIKKSDEIINETIKKLQKSINDGNYDDILEIKSELSENAKINDSMLGESSYLKQNIEDLVKEREYLLSKLKKVSNDYFSKHSGLISYTVDGLEEIYNTNSMYEFKMSDFNVIENNSNVIENSQNIELGQPIFKIVNNYKWYLITKIDNEGMLNLKEGKNLYVRFNEKNKKLKCKIIKIQKKKSEQLLLLQFESQLYDFLSSRYVDIDIIRESVEGLKVPNSAITEKNGIKGVYIKNINNIVSFRPIKIIDKDDEFTIIEEGNNGIIQLSSNGELKNVKSIKRYDEVIVNWSKIKESDIID